MDTQLTIAMTLFILSFYGLIICYFMNRAIKQNLKEELEEEKKYKDSYKKDANKFSNKVFELETTRDIENIEAPEGFHIEYDINHYNYCSGMEIKLYKMGLMIEKFNNIYDCEVFCNRIITNFTNLTE